eukprot:scaffold2008_cov283-Pinguiococcus_pyrenoidosus.AAC.12
MLGQAGQGCMGRDAEDRRERNAVLHVPTLREGLEDRLCRLGSQADLRSEAGGPRQPVLLCGKRLVHDRQCLPGLAHCWQACSLRNARIHPAQLARSIEGARREEAIVHCEKSERFCRELVGRLQCDGCIHRAKEPIFDIREHDRSLHRRPQIILPKLFTGLLPLRLTHVWSARGAACHPTPHARFPDWQLQRKQVSWSAGQQVKLS